MNANLTQVATAIHALSFDQRNQAYEQGGRYSRSSFELDALVTSAAKTLGEKPTFAQWTEYSDEFKAGYINDNPDNTANAADQAWARFTKNLDSKFGLTKPKSTSAAAEKKRGEREKANETLLAKYEETPVIELRDQLGKTYEAMAKHPENKDLKKKQKQLMQKLSINLLIK